LSNYIFDAADSVVVPTGKFLNAFNETGTGNFVLEAGAFLRSPDDNVAYLGGTAKWTVTVNGHIATDLALGPALIVAGASGSKVTIGEEGSISNKGDAYGALSAESDSAITNKGSIRSDAGNGVGLLGDNTSSLVNNGVIIGPNLAVYVEDAANFSLTNSGQIFGGILLSNGNSKFSNSGQITANADFGVAIANVVFGVGADIFDNKGRIDGHIDLGSGLNKATNAGLITGADLFTNGIAGGEDGDTITNAKGGTIQYAVSLGGGVNSFTNAGFVGNNGFDNSVVGGSGVDTVKNSGTLNGDVSLFGGNDVFTNTGLLVGFVNLGIGDDIFKGGNFSETVVDGEGSDKTALGGGNDVFFAYGGEFDGENGGEGLTLADEVDGGAGIDTYDGSLVPITGIADGIRVNLDSVDNEGILKATATNGDGKYIDKLKGIENVNGGSGTDIIYGSAAANVINGNSGNDYLYGLSGNDIIHGGDFDDRIAGGLGADILYGDGIFQGNTFYYTSIKDSGLTKATRDEIMDFNDLATFERIDLNLIDADMRSTAPSDQSFSSTLLLGSGSFTVGQAGDLRIYQTATGWMIEGEVTGDAKADFSIAVRDVDHSIIWNEFNFIL